MVTEQNTKENSKNKRQTTERKIILAVGTYDSRSRTGRGFDYKRVDNNNNKYLLS